MSSENSASIFNTLSDLPSQIEDGTAVLGEAIRLAGALSQENLDAQRHKHLAYILAEQAQLNSNNSHALTSSLNKVSDEPFSFLFRWEVNFYHAVKTTTRTGILNSPGQQN